MKIIMLGIAGSGKGTQAKKISEKFNIPHVSTGDIFREIREENTELGKKVKSLIDAGNLVDDKTTAEVLENRINKDDCKNGFVLDGFPRNLNQASLLEHITDIDFVIYIFIKDETAFFRLSKRIQCKECGAIYGFANPPTEENVCDKCSGELYQRDDEKEDAIKKRLEVYHEQTEPVVDYYNQKGILHKINGERTIDEVFEDIVKVLT